MRKKITRREPQARSVHELINAEVNRQNTRWGVFENSRPSIRLGIACLEDEVREAHDAYDDDRHDDFCGLGFMATQEELVQVSAVAVRLVLALPNKLELGWRS